MSPTQFWTTLNQSQSLLITAATQVNYTHFDGWYEQTLLTRNYLNISEFPESSDLNLIVAPLI